MNTVGHTKTDFIRRQERLPHRPFSSLFSLFCGPRERRERFGYVSLLSFVFSYYRTTRNHVVIVSRENERKTHYYIITTTTTHEFLDS